MSPALALAAAAAALGALAACSDLQPIEANRCGNRIVEKGEACDEGSETALCTAECRLPCVTAEVAPATYVDNPEDSQDGYCPAGQACGVDGLCAAPSGKFRTATSFEFDVPQAEVGDLDNDGVADLIGTGDTEIRVHFGDADGAPLASANHLPAPTATGPFLLANLDNKLGVDLALPSDGGVVPFYATSAGTLQHRPSPTLLFPKEGFVAAVDGVVESAGGQRRPLLVYVEQQGNSAVLRDLAQTGNPIVATCDTGGPASLRIAPLATTSINGGDLLAVGIERALSPGICVFVPANPTAPGDPGWTGRFSALSAGARFDAGVNPLVWANLDGDACPELLSPILTGAGAGTPGVNRLDDSAGCTFTTSAVTVPTWNLGSARILGAGNFDRVGPDEIVTGNRVLRVDSMTALTPLGQPLGMDRLRTGDFNGDGVVDIAGVNAVAAGDPPPESVRILRTSGPAGTWQASTALVETLRPVAQLVVGDYDGDRISDVAVTEIISIDANRVPTSMAVSVIYGQRSDIPSYQVVLEGDPVVIATLGLRRGGAHDEDGVDDLGVAEVVPGATKLAASVLYGSAQRALTAPIRTPAVEKVGAVAAGAWAGADALVDLVVYTESKKQYVWPQLSAGGFDTSGADTTSPVSPQGLRDFAITNAATIMGSRTVVSFATNNKVAAVGGVGGCPGSWTSTGNLRVFGARPSLQARNLDGVAGDELLLTSSPGQGVTSPIQLYPAIAADCKLGQPALAALHPLSTCDAAGIIEAGLGPSGDPARREVLAVCRNALTRFDFTADGNLANTPLRVQLLPGTRRLMVGDFNGDGLEDAIAVSSVGAVDFATLLLQCATTDASCDP